MGTTEILVKRTYIDLLDTPSDTANLQRSRLHRRKGTALARESPLYHENVWCSIVKIQALWI